MNIGSKSIGYGLSLSKVSELLPSSESMAAMQDLDLRRASVVCDVGKTIGSRIESLEKTLAAQNEKIDAKIAELRFFCVNGRNRASVARDSSATSESHLHQIMETIRYRYAKDRHLEMNSQGYASERSGTYHHWSNNIRDDSLLELEQLQETDGIEEYHGRFVLLLNKLKLPEDQMVDAYLQGLQIDTQRNVRMFQPQTIRQCLLMGRLYERAHHKPSTRESAPVVVTCSSLALKPKEEKNSTEMDSVLVTDVVHQVNLILDRDLIQEEDSRTAIAENQELSSPKTDMLLESVYELNQPIVSPCDEVTKEESVAQLQRHILHQKRKSQKGFMSWKFKRRKQNQRSGLMSFHTERSSEELDSVLIRVGVADVVEGVPKSKFRNDSYNTEFVQRQTAIEAHVIVYLKTHKKKKWPKTWRFKFRSISNPSLLSFHISRATVFWSLFAVQNVEDSGGMYYWVSQLAATNRSISGCFESLQLNNYRTVEATAVYTEMCLRIASFSLYLWLRTPEMLRGCKQQNLKSWRMLRCYNAEKYGRKMQRIFKQMKILKSWRFKFRAKMETIK